MELAYILLIFTVAFAGSSLAMILLIIQANNRCSQAAHRYHQHLLRIRTQQRIRQAKGIKR